MAWVTDPNFGNGMTASAATAPFNTDNNNMMIGLNGSGALYRDELNILNVELACDTFFDTRGDPGSISGLLISRRQPDGSFYAATWVLGGSVWTDLTNMTIHIIKYNGISETVTSLGTASLVPFDPDFVNIEELLHLNFRTLGNNLVFNVKDVLNATILEVDITDTTITTAGNPGFGGQLFNFSPPPSTLRRSVSYMDNLNILEI